MHVSVDLPMARLAGRLEHEQFLDMPASALRQLIGPLLASPRRLLLLRGGPLGHAAHPALTDAAAGFWLASTTLDLVGGKTARPAADRLLSLGVLAAVPTVLTGLADWSVGDIRVRRVGVVHAACSVVALTLYTCSWVERRRGYRARGVALSLAAGVWVGAGAFLGGHLASVLKSPVDDRFPVSIDASAPTRDAPSRTGPGTAARI